MANRFDFIEGDILFKFFHDHKTQLVCSCMKNPMRFVRQLRDKSLISEEIYKKIQNTQNPEKDLYDALDWIENNKRTLIPRFWGCVFEKHIMEEYPTLKELQEKLLNKTKLNENLQLGRQNEVRPVVESPVCDEEQPGSSSDVTQPRRPEGTISSSEPMETKSNMAPVTCGDQQGYMDLSKVKDCKTKCIHFAGKWYSPNEFLHLGGKKNGRWKRNIHYKNEPLEKYNISNGRLRKKPRRKRKTNL